MSWLTRDGAGGAAGLNRAWHSGAAGKGSWAVGTGSLEAASLSRPPEVHWERMGSALPLMELPAFPFPSRFKVFADYEDYIKCQEKVSALYKVKGPGPAGAGRALVALAGMRQKVGIPLAE